MPTITLFVLVAKAQKMLHMIYLRTKISKITCRREFRKTSLAFAVFSGDFNDKLSEKTDRFKINKFSKYRKFWY